MSEELKPCQCGSESYEMLYNPNIFAGQTYKEHTNIDGWKYRCEGCGVQTCWWHHKWQVIEAWNNRPREAELLATIKELRESLKKICVYDMYDCSESSDINYHNDAKYMYETAKQALENTKDIK